MTRIQSLAILVMEYIDGITLEAVKCEQRLNLDKSIFKALKHLWELPVSVKHPPSHSVEDLQKAILDLITAQRHFSHRFVRRKHSPMIARSAYIAN